MSKKGRKVYRTYSYEKKKRLKKALRVLLGIIVISPRSLGIVAFCLVVVDFLYRGRQVPIAHTAKLDGFRNFKISFFLSQQV